VLGLFDYPPAWNLNLRVNFVCGGPESEGFVFSGSEGSLQIGWDGITLTRVPREKEPGYTVGTFANATREKFLEAYRKKYPPVHPTGPAPRGQEKFVPPPGYSDSYDHLKNFVEAVRSRKPVVEDATFGYRAAGAALLANLSIEREAIMRWDPEEMKLL